jgi:hypothetical protein
MSPHQDDLGIYWVEHDDDGTWTRPTPLAAGWPAAVHQLRSDLYTAITNAEHASDDGEHDEFIAASRRLLEDLDRGTAAEQRPWNGAFAGRYSRIVPAGPPVSDPIAARLRWLLVRDVDGLRTMTITTRSGHQMAGKVEWNTIDHDAVWIITTRLTDVVRVAQIESFTLDRHERRPA